MINYWRLAFFVLGFGGLAVFFAHRRKAFAFAGVLAFAFVLGRLAIALAFASIHAFTVNLAIFCRNGAADSGCGKHSGRGAGQGDSCELLNCCHGLCLLKVEKSPVFVVRLAPGPVHNATELRIDEFEYVLVGKVAILLH
ncbi:MAG TPA: hypothetical protein VNN78_00465 [Burkholderiales bacterium]|nr:hypothetical protein [Burkholderiales bacterium]